LILKMIELDVEIEAEGMKEEGFHPTRRIDFDGLPKDTWRYENDSHEIYLVVELNESRKVKLIAHYNLLTGEVRRSINGRVNVK